MISRRGGAILGGDDPASSGFKTVARVELFGNTPSLAWSPDSKHVAVAAAYEESGDEDYGYGYGYGYGGYGTTPSDLVSDKLGVHVVSASTGKVVSEFRIGNAYHAVWTSNDTLAWIGDQDGQISNTIVTAKLGGKPRHEKLDYAIYNLQAATDPGRVLFYRSGNDGGWVRYDPKSRTSEKVAPPNRSVSAPGPAWVPPADRVRSQCAQSTGDISTAGVPERVALLVKDKGAVEVTAERPFQYSHWGCAPTDPHCGPRPGCISPDGKHYAFLTSSEVSIWLNVVPLQMDTIKSLAQPTTTPPEPGVAREIELASDRHGDQLPTVVNLVLHGSTPTMSWSPDSKRLVANSDSGEEYYDERGPSVGQGIYVINAETAKVQQLFFHAGFHPVWVGTERVAWVASSYDPSGLAGLFTADLSTERVVARRVLRNPYTYTATPVDDRRLLVWMYDHDDTGVDGWAYVDVDTKNVETADDVPEGSTWEPPNKYVDRQCLQTVGDVKVKTTEKEITVTVGGKKTVVSTAPFQFRHWMCDSDDSDSKYCGPVRACLSPDGSKLAYTSQPEDHTGKHGLKVVKVPR